MLVRITRVEEKMTISANFYSFRKQEVVRIEFSAGEEAILAYVQFALAAFDPAKAVMLYVERRSTNRVTGIVWHLTGSDAVASSARQDLIDGLIERSVMTIGESSGPNTLRHLPAILRRMIVS